MNFKRLLLFSAVFVLASLIISSVFLTSGQEAKYFPVKLVDEQERLSSGYAEYMNLLKANQNTGEVDYTDVVKARKSMKSMPKAKASLGLTWNFRGPDNVGGRTRAIVIDKDNTDHILVGSVSGGIWESFDAATTWQPYDSDFKIKNVSAMTQGPDGAIYVGTGALFDGITSKGKDSFFPGNGLFKLTGNGQSEQLVDPSNASDPGWQYINEIAVDPNNSDRILVAMSFGLQESLDGGQTWSKPINRVDPCYDINISPDGSKMMATFFNRVYSSLDGQTFNSSPFIVSNNSLVDRIEGAISPSNPNIQYIVAARPRPDDRLFGVYRTYDGGQNWSRISVPSTIDFLSNSISGQGFYDNELAVYPNDPGRIICGGVSLFEWRQSSVDPAPIEGQWKSIATTIDGASQSLYVHADKHKFVFHPTNPDICYFGTDGGIARSTNMTSTLPTYSTSNLGYNVTQFYSLGIGPNDNILGGTQDNGTQLAGLGFNTGKSTYEVLGGDGFDCDLSVINPEVGFTSLYFSNVTRLQGIGKTLGGSNFDNANFYNAKMNAFCSDASAFSCSDVFYTVSRLWESFNHKATKDSVLLQIERKSLPPIPAGTELNYESKNNRIPQKGVLPNDLFPVDTLLGDVAYDSVRLVNFSKGVVVNFDTIFLDTTNKRLFVARYDGTNDAFNYNIDQEVVYETTFTSQDNLDGSLFVKKEKENGVFITTLKFRKAQITFYYNYSFPDFVQSMYVVSNFPSTTSRTNRDIWLTKDALKARSDVRWYKIASADSKPDGMVTNNIITCNEFTRDGDILYVGTSNGLVYRLSNLNDIDVSNIPVTAAEDTLVDNVIQSDIIGDFSGRVVTAIAVDPNNPNNLIITLGNYGNSVYVYRTTNATQNNVSFEHIMGQGTGSLPLMPVYGAIIERNDSNTVILGTELGVFATDNAFDASANNVSWTVENTGMGTAPVFAIRQMTFKYSDGVTNEGKIYVATHGRGFFDSDNLVSTEKKDQTVTQSAFSKELKFFPNPVQHNASIEIGLNSKDEVTIEIYSISGQLVKSRIVQNTVKGKNMITLNLNDLGHGTYILRALSGNESKMVKFIKN